MDDKSSFEMKAIHSDKHAQAVTSNETNPL